MDHLRAEVYAAEATAFEGTDLETVRPIADVLAAIERVAASGWWSGPAVRAVAMRTGAESSCARMMGDVVEIRIAAPQATWATAAHELAHALAGVAAGHAPVFRRAMLDVVQMLTNTSLGERRGLAHVEQLAAAYAAAGLRVGRRGWPAPDAGGPIAL